VDRSNRTGAEALTRRCSLPSFLCKRVGVGRIAPQWANSWDENPGNGCIVLGENGL
jgi:hypothetical protein